MRLWGNPHHRQSNIYLRLITNYKISNENENNSFLGRSWPFEFGFLQQ